MNRSSLCTTILALVAMTFGACGGGGGTDSASDTALPDPSTPQAPFGGAAVAVPGTIEAENYDMGGQGVAYHDNDAGNQGGAYRTDEDVDIRRTGDTDGGSYEVSFFEAGEWLNYTVSVAGAADYRIELRVSGTDTDGAFKVQVDGEDVTGSVAVPDTGSDGAHVWTGRGNVRLPAGEHTLTLQAESGSFNVNRLRISPMPDSGPYSGSAIALPGEFEAENFDQGGAGAAYHDLTPGNSGGQYRVSEDVDIATTNDTAGGYDVVEFQPGEWLTYSVTVAEAGSYDLAVRAASENAGSAFHAQVDGQDVTGAVAVPNNGNATYDWTGFSGIFLEAGDHELTVVAEGQAFRMNSVRVTPTPPPPPGTGSREPYHGAPAGAPGVIEAEDFDLGGQDVAYGENVAGNDGGAYRPDEDVDIAAAVDDGANGYEVNNFETGEWLSYSIDVATAGTYDIELRASSAYADSAYRLEIDGRDVSGAVTVPNTGSWSAYTWTVTRDVSLSAGTHVLKVIAEQQYFNLNSIRISDEAPAPPPPPAPGGDATKLFSSGFEGTIDFLPTVDCWGTGCWQDIVGLDVVTNFSWPSNLGNGGGRFLMLTDPAQITPLTLDQYMFNRIETVSGPRGTSTRALYQEISRNANGTEPMGTSPAQNEFQFLPAVDVPELYVSFWVKLQPDLVEKMNNLPDGPGVANGGTWRAFFALKTGGQKPDGGPADDGDYRIESYIMTYGGGQPYWAILGDNNAGGGAPLVNNWSVENRDVPVKVGEWFKFEIYWKRSAGSDGRVWMAVDGEVLADRTGPNTGAWDMPINRIMAPMLYSGSRMPIYQWIDDVEVWTGFPPVGGNPPYGPH